MNLEGYKDNFIWQYNIYPKNKDKQVGKKKAKVFGSGISQGSQNQFCEYALKNF